MLLTISTTHSPASDLGYLLHKHPDRIQSFDLSFGSGHVFYPEASNDRCTACLRYRDKRLAGFDAAAVVEVIEHLDPPQLSALERVLYEHARPNTVVLTTPNAESNRMWATGIAERFGYSVRFVPVGPEDEKVGSPTQRGVFERNNIAASGT